MGRFWLGLLIGVIIWPLAGLIYFHFGFAPVATAAPPMPFEKQLAHMALKARVQREAPKNSPLTASDTNYLAGGSPVSDPLRGLPRTARPARDRGFQGHVSPSAAVVQRQGRDG